MLLLHIILKTSSLYFHSMNVDIVMGRFELYCNILWYCHFLVRFMAFMMSARESMEMLMHGGTVQMFLTT